MKPLISAIVVDNMLNRLALEIVERNRGTENLVLFGIWERGAKLAERIVAHINNLEGTQLEVAKLDVNPFRDEPLPASVLSDAVSISGKNIVLIDDVLFSGRTIFAALQAIRQFGQPISVQLAVLIDRGHRTYPIHSDYCGRYIPTKHKESILVDESQDWAVFLEE
jgi:pyrimidine operon attenuation protein/uracil phosphoribosyltransferase